jgi:hypothetical protein
MATYTTMAAPDNTSLATFKLWAMAISQAFTNFTWTQGTDTGQVVWTASVITSVVTACTTVGALTTYTYTSLTSGPVLRVGMAITTTGMTNGAQNNISAQPITALGTGTFSVVTTTQGAGTNETGSTGSATTTAIAARPNTGATVYEIWVTSDSVGFPVYAKVEYGANGTTQSTPAMFITLGTNTNGAGTLTNPSARTGSTNGQASTTLFACHFSGDGGRMCMFLFHGQGNTTVTQSFSLERSYDNSGTATGSYYTLCFDYLNSGTGNSTSFQQSYFPTGGLTTQETAQFALLMPKTAGTGNVGSTTFVSPVFPLVGGIGNPMTNILGFRAADFSDNQIVYVTLYGVQHTYVTFSKNDANISPQGVAAGLMYRYD